jgi:hypothetical protein
VKALIFGMAIAVAGSIVFAAPAAAQAPTKEQLQASWRATIANTPAPGKGCYTATYPLAIWKQVECVKAPERPYVPASGHGTGQTTGDGNDYSAVVSGGLMTSTVGSFPKVKGVTSEMDGNRANSYSLQVNSNFMSGSPACSTANVPANCLAWEQFVYSSTEAEAFMQYWLIHYSGGTVHCPSGWISFSDDCFKNSAAVRAPLQTIDQLPFLQVSGTAVAAGIDTLVFTTKTQAYTTTGADSVVALAAGWNASEFNIIGDGGGSQANFNAGSKVTVRVAVTNGTTNAPVCQANDGTTGETNNLNLKKCKVKGGAQPYAQFAEVLKKTK